MRATEECRAPVEFMNPDSAPMQTPLEDLTAGMKTLIAGMQTPEARKAVDRAFAACGKLRTRPKAGTSFHSENG